MQLRWTTVSNWLFTLIRDQFRPYELWFWLEGRRERGSATSLPRFTAGFKRPRRLRSLRPCGLSARCCPASHSALARASPACTVALRGRAGLHLLDLSKSEGPSSLVPQGLAAERMRRLARVSSKGFLLANTPTRGLRAHAKIESMSFFCFFLMLLFCFSSSQIKGSTYDRPSTLVVVCSAAAQTLGGVRRDILLHLETFNGSVLTAAAQPRWKSTL